MSDVKPGVVTTVPVCEQCKGKHKVLVSDGSYVLCACTLESVASSEARISGLERLFLQHEGMDMSLMGEPKPMGDRDFRPLDRPFIPFVQCAQCKSTTATKPMIVIDADATLPRGSELPPEYDVCSEACAKAWHAQRVQSRPGVRMTGTIVTVFKDDFPDVSRGAGWLIRVLCSDGLVRVYDIDNETFGRSLGYMHNKVEVHVRPSTANAWDVMPASLATKSGLVCAETLSAGDIVVGATLTDRQREMFAPRSRVTHIMGRCQGPRGNVVHMMLDSDPNISVIVTDEDIRSGRIDIDLTSVGTKVPR